MKVKKCDKDLAVFFWKLKDQPQNISKALTRTPTEKYDARDPLFRHHRKKLAAILTINVRVYGSYMIATN